MQSRSKFKCNLRVTDALLLLQGIFWKAATKKQNIDSYFLNLPTGSPTQFSNVKPLNPAKPLLSYRFWAVPPVPSLSFSTIPSYLRDGGSIRIYMNIKWRGIRRQLWYHVKYLWSLSFTSWKSHYEEMWDFNICRYL